MAEPSETTQISHGPSADETTVGPETAELLRAIRELSSRVGTLQAEVRALRASSPSLPSTGSEPAGWEDSPGGSRDTLAWVRALDAPAPRGPTIPRFLLEIVFLVGVAVAAAVAELDIEEIAVVMAIAWILVALGEWAAARSARSRSEAAYVALPGVGSNPGTDPSWFAPSVERAVIDRAEPGEDTQTKLPPPDER